MNQSVFRALNILEMFVEEPEMSLAEISRKAMLDKATAYRLITTLETGGYLQKIRHTDQDVRYRLGMKLLELGHIVSERLELRKTALPHMQALCSEIDEVVHLVVTDGAEAVYIEKVESQQHVRLFTRIGKRSPLYAGSGPRLLLAYLPFAEQEKIIGGELKVLTEQTITNPERLRAELERIRLDGYATSHGEQDTDTVGISFPIRDYSGTVVAALGVSGVRFRFVGERQEFVKGRTQVAAEGISADLGARH